MQVLSERLKKQNTLFRLNRFKIVRVVLELLYVSHSSKQSLFNSYWAAAAGQSETSRFSSSSFLLIKENFVQEWLFLNVTKRKECTGNKILKGKQPKTRRMMGLNTYRDTDYILRLRWEQVEQ